MKRKRKIVIITGGILAILVVIFFLKYNTWLYVTVDQTRSTIPYDITVYVDDKQVFSQDSVYIPLMGHERLQIPLRLGFHRVKAHSNKANLTEERTVFLFFGQLVLVEYFGETEYQKQDFRIETMFLPYRYI